MTIRIPEDIDLCKEATADEQRQAVTSLGITIREGETPVRAWLRAMHEENGLANQIPIHPALVDQMEGQGVSFIMWLFTEEDIRKSGKRVR